jgi:cell fate regulator YaaT (PSP1 superfamily)
MELPSTDQLFDWVEVRFKNGRKEFYHNANGLPLQLGDAVAVEAHSGHDVGNVSITGELVKLQMNKKNFKIEDQEPVLKVYRKASEKDLETWASARGLEKDAMMRSREVAQRLSLKMKISDVEYQGDGSKATFYYTADERVDFRQLIRELAQLFSVRIEMRQIGARQEAQRLGGIGSCGRELCCSTWLSDFRSVNTAAARYQQLSLNPQKLAG